VTLQQAATALKDKLGDRYEITTHGSGDREALKVKQSAASAATVHLTRDGDATVFHVHGGGLIISRKVNEFGIAKKQPPRSPRPSQGDRNGRHRGSPPTAQGPIPSSTGSSATPSPSSGRRRKLTATWESTRWPKHTTCGGM
jgi:hypothetical protein